MQRIGSMNINSTCFEWYNPGHILTALLGLTAFMIHYPYVVIQLFIWTGGFYDTLSLCCDSTVHVKSVGKILTRKSIMNSLQLFYRSLIDDITSIHA